MRIKKIPPRNAEWSSLKGYVDASYARLVEVFGEPNSKGDGYKQDAVWVVSIGATICTIYNYKNGRNYYGPSAPAVQEMTHWHVGGFSANAVECVRKALNMPQ